MRRGESKLWTGPGKKLGTFLLEKSNKTYCCRACLPTDGKMTNLFKGKANIIDGFFFFSRYGNRHLIRLRETKMKGAVKYGRYLAWLVGWHRPTEFTFST